ncbi:hypothetical protein Btru_029145 [Bulinus truncatus]|nr:hypothetical protein Btru_029145 [Bulinus truncatus]
MKKFHIDKFPQVTGVKDIPSKLDEQLSIKTPRSRQQLYLRVSTSLHGLLLCQIFTSIRCHEIKITNIIIVRRELRCEIIHLAAAPTGVSSSVAVPTGVSSSVSCTERSFIICQLYRQGFHHLSAVPTRESHHLSAVPTGSHSFFALFAIFFLLLLIVETEELISNFDTSQGVVVIATFVHKKGHERMCIRSVHSKCERAFGRVLTATSTRIIDSVKHQTGQLEQREGQCQVDTDQHTNSRENENRSTQHDQVIQLSYDSINTARSGPKFKRMAGPGAETGSRTGLQQVREVFI